MRNPWSRLSKIFNHDSKIKHYKWFWCRDPRRIFGDIMWWIRHRTINRNHVIETDLTPGWWDADTRLVHASFSILERFVESEKPFDRIEWNEDDASREYSNEIHALYLWWKVRKNADLDSETMEQENKRYEEETENLVRLAKIRMCLWT